jgi:hypothetical protein
MGMVADVFAHHHVGMIKAIPKVVNLACLLTDYRRCV